MQSASRHANIGDAANQRSSRGINPGIGAVKATDPPGCACLLAVTAEGAVGQAGGRAVGAELHLAGIGVVALAEVVAIALLTQVAERAVASAAGLLAVLPVASSGAPSACQASRIASRRATTSE